MIQSDYVRLNSNPQISILSIARLDLAKWSIFTLFVIINYWFSVYPKHCRNLPFYSKRIYWCGLAIWAHSFRKSCNEWRPVTFFTRIVTFRFLTSWYRVASDLVHAFDPQFKNCFLMYDAIIYVARSYNCPGSKNQPKIEYRGRSVCITSTWCQRGTVNAISELNSGTYFLESPSMSIKAPPN